MKIAFLLHFYQPINQEDDILHRIVYECYLPLTQGLLSIPNIKLTFNVSGALLKLLHDKGYIEVIENMQKLIEQGKVSLTGSAMYHAFLPLLPSSEVWRQIQANEEIGGEFFGEVLDRQGFHNTGKFKLTGFFPPEMGIDNNVLSIIKEAGYSWVSVEETAFDPPLNNLSAKAERRAIYRHTLTDLGIFFRHKRVSSLILSAQCRTAADLIKETTDIHNEAYWFCAMDAETFGHHRVGHQGFLFDILKNPFFTSVTPDELLMNSDLPVKNADLRPSTWTNQEQDFWVDAEKKIKTYAKSFILWKDPENPIHEKQWELTNHIISVVNSVENKNTESFKLAREALDSAVSSDQYWWASAKPWWSLELVVLGAYSLKKVLELLKASQKDRDKAESLYREILDRAFDWQRTGYVRKRHLDASETFMKYPFKKRTPAEWFNQVVLEFEREMDDSAVKQDFEKAIKWRDAIYKIKSETDIYDVLHVVNELWSARSAMPWATPKVKPFLQHEWSEFSDFAKKHFVEASTKEEFDAWKARARQNRIKNFKNMVTF